MASKETFAKNLQYYMDMHGKTRRDMSEALKINYNTFTDWIRGRKYPRMDKVQLLADYFGISMADLLEERTKHDKTGELNRLMSAEYGTESIITSKAMRIPVLGQVVAGIPIEAIEDVVDWEELPIIYASRGEYFGLKIKGDSMLPSIRDKDVVIVRKQNDAESGDVVIAAVNGNEATCKKLVKHENGVSLVSFNPAFEPMYFSVEEINNKPVTILGKVIECRQKYE